jgi:3-(3-hydroxy-phenyl)propionate hydroxylase
MSPDFSAYPFTPQSYPPRLPTLADGGDVQRHPVVIAGAGPVGLTAALGLARQGVRVLLVEADDGVCRGSRAICISRRSLEIMQRVGALQGFLDVGLPWTGGRSYYRAQEVLHFKMPQDENQKLPPMLNLAQYHIEQILLDEALKYPKLIDIRWQTRVTQVKAHADGVQLGLSNALGSYKLDTDWLVAADGGRSFVRESLGLQLQGTRYEGRYIIVDILMKSSRPTERLAYFDPPCNPGSTVLVHKQPHDVWRIDYQLRDGENPDEATRPENVLPRVQSLLDMMGETAPWQPIWITLYKANALSLERYCHGRVVFAGDAAHLVPIFGVRGANSGIDDADNLAWKLAHVLQGKASEKLLDSYSQERVAAAQENLSYGRKSTEFMAPPSFAFDLMRTAVLSLAAAHPQLSSLINPRQTSAIAYRQSPLNGPDSGGFSAGPAPGTVLPECPVQMAGQGSAHLTDVLHLAGASTFTALYFSSKPELPADFSAPDLPFKPVLITCSAGVAPALQSPHVVDHTGRLFELFGAAPGSLYLVRPDGHVLARWQQCPACQDIVAAITYALNGGAV